MRGQGHARGGADLGELFNALHIGEVVHAGAAVLFREGDAEHAQLRHLRDGLLRESCFLVKIRSEGLNCIFRKIPVQGDQIQVVLIHLKHIDRLLKFFMFSAYAFFFFNSSIISGRTFFTSPPMPTSATEKIGASSSLLMAMMYLLPTMPDRCWVAPETPQAM